MVEHAEPVAEESAVTSLSDRPRTALLVIDVQNDVVANSYNRDGVIANIAGLVGKARAERAKAVQRRWLRDLCAWRAVIPEACRAPGAGDARTVRIAAYQVRDRGHG